MRTHTHIHTDTHTHTYTHISTQIYTYTHTHRHIHTYTHMKENPKETSGDVGESEKDTLRLTLALLEFGLFGRFGWALGSLPLPPTP